MLNAQVVVSTPYSLNLTFEGFRTKAYLRTLGWRIISDNSAGPGRGDTWMSIPGMCLSTTSSNFLWRPQLENPRLLCLLHQPWSACPIGFTRKVMSKDVKSDRSDDRALTFLDRPRIPSLLLWPSGLVPADSSIPAVQRRVIQPRERDKRCHATKGQWREREGGFEDRL